MSFDNAQSGGDAQSVFLNTYMEKMKGALINLLTNSLMQETKLDIANAQLGQLTAQIEELRNGSVRTEQLTKELGELKAKQVELNNASNNKDSQILSLKTTLTACEIEKGDLINKVMRLESLNNGLLEKVAELEFKLTEATKPAAKATKKSKEVVTPEKDDF